MRSIYNWQYSQTDRREATGVYDDGVWRVEFWVWLMDDETQEDCQKRVVDIVPWIKTNETKLKQTIVENDFVQDYGTPEEFFSALEPWLLTVNQNNSFEIEYLPLVDTELWEVMGGHGIYVEVSPDRVIKGTTGAG